MIGQTLSHYRILEKLGSGGMGDVYRARDEQLYRDVAIKVLNGGIDDSVGMSHLLREARAAAALNHANVCTIHDVASAGGQSFIVMELIDGRPLSALVSDRPLPVEQVLVLAYEIADAVAHAHSRGIVHRDLKPANVIVTADGRAKVLDFGIAKRLYGGDPAAPTETVTRGGIVAGTLPYLSPEQLSGLAASAASDVWALGVMMYEMLTGRRPFRAGTEFGLSAAILHQPPAPLPADVPTAVQALVERCLEKDVDRRFASAGDVRAALDAIRTGGMDASTAWRSRLARMVIAVLPFENSSGDPSSDYLSDGLTEEMITQLGRLHPQRLAVIARSSAMRYRKSGKPVEQIGRELNADYILEGTVRQIGHLVRVGVELIAAADGTVRWAEGYERELSRFYALQHELARGVARALALRLLPAEEARLGFSRPVSAEAHEAYLLARFHWYKLTPRDIELSLQYFELARQKDPRYAAVYTGIADVWGAMISAGVMLPREAGAKAKAALDAAAGLDDSLPEYHGVLGKVKTWVDWDWEAGEQAFQRAIQLNPSYAEARVFRSILLASLKRPAEARSEISRAIELDPHNFFFHWIAGFNLLLAHDVDGAVPLMKKSLEMEPRFPGARWGLWSAAHLQQRFDEAKQYAAELLAVYAAHVPAAVAALDEGHSRAGYQAGMIAAADMLAAAAEERYVKNELIAELYACGGQADRALTWLERAHEVRDIEMAYLAVHPIWAGIRSDARFRALLRRLRLPD